MSLRFVALSLGCALFGACGGSKPGPNVLVLLLDTTRADHLSCYGYERETTPTVDEIARRGVRFAEAYSQSSLTPVSAGTLLSGAYPFHHQVRSLFVVDQHEMSRDVASLPELLQGSGRHTAAFVSAKPMGARYGLSRGFELYQDDLSETQSRYHIDEPTDAAQRPADDTTDLALKWLDGHGREPFALLVHFFDAHDPSFVPPRDWLAQHVSFPLPPELERSGPEQRIPALFTEPKNRVELYDAELRFMDEQFARLLAKLDELHVRDDTLIAIVADHGEAFGEHGFWTHGILYQEQLHVPLILAGPGIPPGKVVEERSRLVDFLPTLAELLDLRAIKEPLDGRSLAGFVTGTAHEEPREVYSEVHHAAKDRLGREPEMYSLRVKDWKYVHRPHSGKHELYDLRTDPLELHNLYTPEHQVARALAFRIGQLGALGGALPSLDGLTQQQLDELRRLGYL